MGRTFVKDLAGVELVTARPIFLMLTSELGRDCWKAVAKMLWKRMKLWLSAFWWRWCLSNSVPTSVRRDFKSNSKSLCGKLILPYTARELVNNTEGKAWNQYGQGIAVLKPSIRNGSRDLKLSPRTLLANWPTYKLGALCTRGSNHSQITLDTDQPTLDLSVKAYFAPTRLAFRL